MSTKEILYANTDNLDINDYHQTSKQQPSISTSSPKTNVTIDNSGSSSCISSNGNNEINHNNNNDDDDVIVDDIDNENNNINNNKTFQSSSNTSIYGEKLDDFIDELRLRTIDNEDDDMMIMIMDGDLSENNQINNSSQQQQHSMTSLNNNNNDILLTRLAKKEKDLILAAELGKALLDRNEELSKMNERLNEEYTKNIELLEQEKYALKKKLNSIEIEYENKLHDLQHDLEIAKENLRTHVDLNKQNESETNRIITELTEQNRRLTNELKETTDRESLLEKEIQSLKEQFSARRINFSDHIGQLEGLRDEINLLTKRKRELENKISALNDEKMSISITLDETQYRIMSLEKELNDKDLNIQNQQKDLEELRRTIIHYQNRIDSLMKMRTFDLGAQQVSSLYNEIEISSQTSSSNGDDHHNHHQHHQNHLHQHHNHNNNNGYLSDTDDIDMFPIDCNRCFKMKQEIGDLYQKLKQLYDDLHKRINQSEHHPLQKSERKNSNTEMNDIMSSSNASSSSSSTNGESSPTSTRSVDHNHDSGIQTNLFLMDDLNMIVCDIQDLIKNCDFISQCSSCQQFRLERMELERLYKTTQQDKEEISKLKNEILQLSSSSMMNDAELTSARERLAAYEQDKQSDQQTQDEIVSRALKMRDETIARKNLVEIELAKIRIELMHVNSQLLETIQQKVELSQQLEQWQVDMEILIEEQLRNKLSLQENSSSYSTINGVTMQNNYLSSNHHKKENRFNLTEKLAKLLSYQRS